MGGRIASDVQENQVRVPSSSLRCEIALFRGSLYAGGMLKHRHDRTDLFALVPQIGLRFEPQLEPLDLLLEDDELLELGRADLARRYPKTRSRGRPSTPVEVILRMLVVMRLYRWSYEQAEYFVNDSPVLRQSRRVYLEKVPDDTTPIRWANTIGPETVERINGQVVQPARSLEVTRGRKLRVDTTAVETEIHFPTDSGLIVDGVRVVSGRNHHPAIHHEPSDK